MSKLHLEDELSELKKRVETLTNIIEKNSGGAVDRFRSKAREAGAAVRHYIDDSPVKEKYNELKQTATDYEHKVEDNVQRHPLMSLGVAFVGGLIISALFGRRK